jgi:hypothetical protein
MNTDEKILKVLEDLQVDVTAMKVAMLNQLSRDGGE